MLVLPPPKAGATRRGQSTRQTGAAVPVYYAPGHLRKTSVTDESTRLVRTVRLSRNWLMKYSGNSSSYCNFSAVTECKTKG